MAQNANTVTNNNPSPPTNFSSVGAMPPSSVPNYTKNTYADAQNWGAGSKTYPPPYYDDGTAGASTTFAANTSALASGSADTAGGTGNPTGSTAGTPGTYPGGTLAVATDPPWRGTVPASSSGAHEGAGAETVVTNPGNIAQSYPGSVTMNTSQSFGLSTPALTPGTMPVPNQLHASSLSPATNPALASISPTTATSGASGTDTITCTGTNFTKQSVVWVQHGTLAPVPVATTFVSATSLTAPVPKRTSAGASVVYVVTGGVVTTVTKALTYS